jgi:glutaredoxin
MKAQIKIFIVLSLLFVFSSPASSQIYQWKDKDGNIHFSDTPPSGVRAKEMKIKEGREGPGKKEESVPSRQSTEKRAYGDIEVIIYLTEWCPASRKAREYLNSLGVKLVQYDVEQDKDKEREMLGKSGGRDFVPVIDVEGIVLEAGFSPKKIDAAIEKRRSLK